MEKQHKKKKKKSYYWLVTLVTVALFVFAWYLATDVYRLASPRVLPGPVRVMRAVIVKMYDPRPDGSTLLQHLWASLQVALSGYGLGLAIGIPLGVLMAWYAGFDMFARPLFDVFRPIPGIAWIPVMIILFGIGLLSKSMVIFLSSFTASLISSYSGIRQTRDVHLWVGRTFGASDLQLLFYVALPTSLPMVLTGMRVALASSWGALVAAELLASTRGLGFMIQQSRGLLRPDVIIAGMIAIGVVGAFLTYLLTLLERWVLKGGRW